MASSLRTDANDDSGGMASVCAPEGQDALEGWSQRKENARLWLGAAPGLPPGIAEVLRSCGSKGYVRS